MVMPILAGIGKIAGPVAQIAGGLGSVFGGSGGSSRLRKYPYESMKYALQWRVQDAKKAGLHPLAGMGLSNISAPYLPENRRDWSNAGQDVAKGLSRIFDTRQKRLLDAEIALTNARVDTEHAKALALSREINSRTQGTPGVQTDSSGQIIDGQADSDPHKTNAIIPEKPAQSKAGLEHGLQGLFTMHRWPIHGEPDPILYIPNQNAQEWFTEGVGKGYATANEILKRKGWRPPSPPRSFLKKGEWYMWSNAWGAWVIMQKEDLKDKKLIQSHRTPRDPLVNRLLRRGAKQEHRLYQ